MGRGKLLTVSVAAYNVEKTIRQCLDSLVIPEIMDQLEVFVIDDGGSDASLGIAKEYEAMYPDTFHPVHKENGGYGSTVNYGIAHASGKYFKQLDGDDWFDRDGLIALVEKLRDLEVDYILTPTITYNNVTGDRRKGDRFKYLSEGEYGFENLKAKKYATMHNSTFRTSLLQSGGVIITEHCFYTDVELVVRSVPFIDAIYVCHDPVYVYRCGQEGQSMSAKNMQRYYLDHETVFWNCLEVYDHLSPDERFKREFIMLRLKWEAAAHFKWLLLLPFSQASFKKCRQFYQKLSQSSPEVLSRAKQHGRYARIMIETRCWVYPVMKLLYEIKKQLSQKRRGGK